MLPKNSLCLPLLLLTVTVAAGQSAAGCDVISCLQPLNCGQLEQCLLVAEKEGCSRDIITYSAFDAYKLCLFGATGFCSLSSLTECYNNYLLPFTKTGMSESAGLNPQSLTGFIRVLLENAAASYTSMGCSIPVTAVQKMTQCVLTFFSDRQRYCETALSISTERYFHNQNLKTILKSSHIALLRSLTNYTEKCSKFGTWSHWYNDHHPTRSSNSGDSERITANTCGGNRPIGVECALDEGVPQLCGVSPCPSVTNFVCTKETGLSCNGYHQPPFYNGSCPCCDFKIRFRCPIPDVVMMNPTFGPVSGGTNVTIVGAVLPRVGLIILIGTSDCPPQDISANRVICKVPPLPGGLSNLAEKTLPLYLMRYRTRVPLNISYTYRGTPVIENVYALNTIVSGGTNVTVEGKNLRSLSQPTMIITAEFTPNNFRQTFHSTCWILSNVQMNCPVPALVDPTKFASTISALSAAVHEEDVATRRRRSAFHLMSEYHVRRHVRQAACGLGQSTAPINSNGNLLYMVNFSADGQTISQNYDLNVRPDPSVSHFEEGPTCRILPNWQPNTNLDIEIMGSNLNSGISCEQYNIRVGSRRCHVTSLSANKMVCNLPAEGISSSDGNVPNQLGVEVLIGNGNLRFSVGCLISGKSLNCVGNGSTSIRPISDTRSQSSGWSLFPQYTIKCVLFLAYMLQYSIR